jgi:succinyl-CoA synthetase beta subunit
VHIKQTEPYSPWKNLAEGGIREIKKAAEQIIKLYKLFRKLDCTQLEINPFGETPDHRGI